MQNHPNEDLLALKSPILLASAAGARKINSLQYCTKSNPCSRALLFPRLSVGPEPLGRQAKQDLHSHLFNILSPRHSYLPRAFSYMHHNTAAPCIIPSLHLTSLPLQQMSTAATLVGQVNYSKLCVCVCVCVCVCALPNKAILRCVCINPDGLATSPCEQFKRTETMHKT